MVLERRPRLIVPFDHARPPTYREPAIGGPFATCRRLP